MRTCGEKVRLHDVLSDQGDAKKASLLASTATQTSLPRFFLRGHVGSKIIFIDHFQCKKSDFVLVLRKWFNGIILFAEGAVGKYTQLYTDPHITTTLISL
jgi:hypothetical protein